MSGLDFQSTAADAIGNTIFQLAKNMSLKIDYMDLATYTVCSQVYDMFLADMAEDILTPYIPDTLEQIDVEKTLTVTLMLYFKQMMMKMKQKTFVAILIEVLASELLADQAELMLVSSGLTMAETESDALDSGDAESVNEKKPRRRKK